jgi:hypothetical protein
MLFSGTLIGSSPSSNPIQIKNDYNETKTCRALDFSDGPPPYESVVSAEMCQFCDLIKLKAILIVAQYVAALHRATHSLTDKLDGSGTPTYKA